LLLIVAFLPLMLSCEKKNTAYCYQCNETEFRSTNLTDTAINFQSQWIIRDSVVLRVCDVKPIHDTTLQKILVQQKLIEKTHWEKIIAKSCWVKSVFFWSEIETWNNYEED
jgi:hypothetical protein